MSDCQECNALRAKLERMADNETATVQSLIALMVATEKASGKDLDWMNRLEGESFSTPQVIHAMFEEIAGAYVKLVRDDGFIRDLELRAEKAEAEREALARTYNMLVADRVAERAQTSEEFDALAAALASAIRALKEKK